MTNVVSPLHTVALNGKPLRFFRAPSGRPELPWHAMDDLFAVCGFNRDMRRHFLRSAQSTFGDDIRTIATTTGPVTIAPHAAAQALLGAAAEVRFEHALTLESYTLAASQSLDVMAGDLPPEAKFRFLMEAAHNSNIAEEANGDLR